MKQVFAAKQQPQEPVAEVSYAGNQHVDECLTTTVGAVKGTRARVIQGCLWRKW